MSEKFLIKSLSEVNLSEIIDLVSENGFIPASANPKESTLASVFEFQTITNNFGFDKALTLYYNEKLVGVLFLLAHQLQYKSKCFFCIQGSTGYVSPEYRGVFKMFLNHLTKIADNTFLLFMFSAPAVHKAAKNMGFHEVCRNQFLNNNYLLLRPFSFLKSNVRQRFLCSLVKIFLIFDKVLCNYIGSKTLVINEYSSFEGDYSLIEVDYNREYYEYLVPTWNAKLLKAKYQKCCGRLKDLPNRNTCYHFVALNSDNKIVGSLVARKITNHNRLVIVELHTTIEMRKEIVKNLIEYLAQNAKKSGFEAIMFNGIGSEYEKCLKHLFFKVSKKADLRVFLKENFDTPFFNAEIPIKLFYSTDDINY